MFVSYFLAFTPNTNTLLIAIFIPLVGVVSPLLIAAQLNRANEQKEKRGYARQDAVAAEALRQQKEVAAEALRQQKEVADEALRQQDQVRADALEVARLSEERQRESDRQFGENSRRLEAVAKVAAESQVQTVQHLGDIKILADKTHTLVNSNLTNEMQGRLDSYRDKLVLLEEIHDLKKATGLEPTAAALSVVNEAKNQIELLQSQMDERARQTDISEKLASEAERGNHPQNVVVVNESPLPVKLSEEHEQPAEVVVVNPDPVDVSISEKQSKDTAREVVSELKKQE